MADEALVVLAIVVVTVAALLGLAYPAVGGADDRGNRVDNGCGGVWTDRK